MRCEIRDRRGRGVPVVYVPGIDGTGRMLLSCADRLAERCDLSCLSYIADDTADRDGYEQLAGEVLARIDELGHARTLLLAESFGGAVALQTALHAPERIAGLAIVNSFCHYRRRLHLAMTRLSAPLLPRWAFDIGRRALAPWTLFGKRREPEAIAEFRSIAGGEFGVAYRRRLKMIAGLDLRPRLGEITQAVTLFVGTKDRVVDSLRSARLMAAALPDARVEILEGAGHLILPLRSYDWPAAIEELAERGGLA